MYILGVGTFRIHPVFPFLVADYMDQSYMRHFFLHKSKLGCIVCRFPTLSNPVYDPFLHEKRNMTELNLLAITGEEAFNVKLANEGKIPKDHPKSKV